jgi:NAD(P)H-hydrate epimerase
VSAPVDFPLVLSAAQMRAADRAATERLGVPSLVLMENAGRGVAELVRARVDDAEGFVAIVCGGGANGGDGFVAARHLAQRGVAARVLLCAPPARLAGDAALNFAALQRLGTVAIDDGSAWTEAAAWRARLEGASAIVDAIFGIGLRDAIAGAPAAALEAMNEARALKVAVDVPSGLDADTGRPTGPVFRADVTATMGARKLGLVIDAAAPVGDVEVIDLGVPITAAADAGPLVRWIDGAAIHPVLPRRGTTAHKGTAGHLLIVAGSAGKTGSALLAGRAALRGGAGLVTLASTASGQAALDAKVLEIMTASYAPGEDADPKSSGPALGAIATGKGAVAIGPGIPTGPNMRALVRDFAARLAAPMVIDADALNLLGSDIVRVLSNVPAPRVLTPHPGEMARLTGRSVQEIQANRLASARDLAARTRAVVVLKGARTLVAAPDGTVYVNPTAEGALGTAGTGDVLTGLLGSLLVQGLDALAAARAAVFIHGAAGELVARRLGSGLMAGDLPDAIADVIQAGAPRPAAR